jgi:hypothetical protein
MRHSINSVFQKLAEQNQVADKAMVGEVLNQQVQDGNLSW